MDHLFDRILGLGGLLIPIVAIIVGGVDRCRQDDSRARRAAGEDRARHRSRRSLAAAEVK